MIIKVNPHEIEFTQDIEINAGEYNITTLEFDFSEEYEELTNMAVFSTCENSYKTPILNNQCVIPYEVLEETGNVLLGVYGYEGDEELTLRYSPTPKYFHVVKGSYCEAGDPELPPKSEWEQVVEEVNEAINEANNLNIEAEKEDNTTTITITHKDGQEQTVEILDGEKGDKGDKGDPGAIKFEIVAELPTENIKEDTIYLVPITPDTQGNNYAEYIYVNGQWELLGKIGVQIDLTNYVQFTDYASSSKAGVVKTLSENCVSVNTNTGAIFPSVVNYSLYQSGGNWQFISKGTLENVITGKGLVSNTDYASSSVGGVVKIGNGFSLYSTGTPYASIFDYTTYQSTGNDRFISKGTLENVITGKDLTTKSYVDGLVGDIETLLEVLDIGSGAVEEE